MRAAFVGVFAAHVADRVRARLRIPCEVALVDDREIVARLGDVDVLVTMAFTREMAAVAPRLRLVQVPGAGLDRIDRTALGPGTALANAYGHDTGIAEYVLGAMLAMSRAFCRIDADLRRGQWDSVWSGAAVPLWSELAGKTLGILGYGRIGQAVARRALAFDMEVLAIRRDPSQPDPHRLAFVRGPAAVDEVLGRADYLAVTLALTPDTRGLIDARRLRLMKPTAILINVARGEVVDEDALYLALRDGTIAGAALDVWYRYPAGGPSTLPGHRPFHTLSNVLMTPHVSGWTEGMMDARAGVIAENIHRIARGDPPLNLIR
ncbi:MAG TPA: 2-hydroxyacid dehydrogenase [Candidatus Deferrimicrobiaceae bacterium]|nr:2-hydroxyacid dehydrogenase [Candidatus Deferrimicrobiaceae bacterium]